MRNKLGNALWGIALILVGVGFAGNVLLGWDFSLFFSGWWTLFIIVPSVISIIKHGFRVMNLIGLAAGVLFLMSAQGFINSNILGKLILPLVLVCIGLGIIFRGSLGKHFKAINFINSQNPNMPEYTAIFGGQDVRPLNERFFGATLTSIFGSVNLDLRSAVIEQDVVINGTVIFGGAEIFLPRGVNVKVSGTPIFGGISIHASNDSPAGPTVYVSGICLFGGIDIK